MVGVPVVCPGHTRPVVDVEYAATSDGVFIISACHDKKPMLRWGASNQDDGNGMGDWIGTFVGHKGAVWGASLSPEAHLAATGGGDFTARLWDAVTGEERCCFEHKHIVKSVSFAPDGTRLLTGGMDKKARQYDVGTALKLSELEVGAKINKVAWLDHNGATLVSGCEDGIVRIWDTRSGRVEDAVKVGATGVKDLEVNRKRSVLTVAVGKKVCFFETKTRSLVKENILKIDVEAASLHPNGKSFVAGGSDLWVHVFDYSTNKEIECNKGHHGPIFCMRFAPDGNSYASGSEDGTIRIWKTTPLS